jgi:hypothetical protein
VVGIFLVGAVISPICENRGDEDVALSLLQMAELFNPGILLDIVDDEWLMDKLPNDGTLQLQDLYVIFLFRAVGGRVNRETESHSLNLFNRRPIPRGRHTSSR